LDVRLDSELLQSLSRGWRIGRSIQLSAIVRVKA